MTVRALLVVAHPRRDSLTFAVANAFATAASRHGVEFEHADLVGEGFDATLRVDDEPDWSDPDKVYSATVQAEVARIARNQATVIVFPVWWWSVPAILKGWIDRVWNHGFAYGASSYPHRRVWMLGLAGTTEDAYAKRGYDAAMRTQLETGVLEYCGIEDRRLELLYGVIEGAAEAALVRAASLGEEFASGPQRAR
jgi:NAD(P)H dehydrogenase (quinone)